MAPHAIDPQPVSTKPVTAETVEQPLEDLLAERAPLRTVFPPLNLEEHPIDDYPSIRAIIVGSGPAGIIAGILLQHKVPGLKLTIFERDSDIVS